MSLENGAATGVGPGYVTFNFATRYLYNKVAKIQIRRNIFTHIPFAIVYLLFAGIIIFGDGNYYAARAIEEVIGLREAPPTPYEDPTAVDSGPQWVTNFVTIENVDDFFTWFSGVAIPSFYDYLSRSDGAMRPMIQGTDSIPQGPMRLRVLNVAGSDPSAVDSDVIDPRYRPSYPKYSGGGGGVNGRDSIFNTSTFEDSSTNTVVRYSNDCSYGGMRHGGMLVTSPYPCGGHILDFLPSWSFDDAVNAVAGVKEMGLIDSSATRLIEVLFYVYVPTTDRFIATLMQVEVSAGGSMFPHFYSSTIYLIDERWAWLEWLAVAVITIFLLENMWSWCRQTALKYRCFGLMECVFDLYTYFELGLIGVLAASIVFYVKLRVASLAFSNNEGIGESVTITSMYDYYMTQLGGNATVSALLAERFHPSAIPIQLDVNKFNLRFWSLRGTSQLTRDLVGYTCLLIFLRLLTLFRAFDALSWVTRVFEAVVIRIIGVLCVLFLVVASFAAGGTIAFGHVVYEYRDFFYAFEAAMLVVLGDRFEFDNMKKAYPNASVVFTWALIVLGSFLLLNFVMALLGEAFDDFTQRREEEAEQRVLRATQGGGMGGGGGGSSAAISNRVGGIVETLRKTRRYMARGRSGGGGSSGGGGMSAICAAIVHAIRRASAPPVTRSLLEEVIECRARLKRLHLARCEAQRAAENRQRERIAAIETRRRRRAACGPRKEDEERESEEDVDEDDEEGLYFSSYARVPRPLTFVYSDVRRNVIVTRHKQEKPYYQCYQSMLDAYTVMRLARAAGEKDIIKGYNAAAGVVFGGLRGRARHQTSTTATADGASLPPPSSAANNGAAALTPLEQKVRMCRDQLLHVQTELDALQRARLWRLENRQNTEFK